MTVPDLERALEKIKRQERRIRILEQHVKTADRERECTHQWAEKAWHEVWHLQRRIEELIGRIPSLLQEDES